MGTAPRIGTHEGGAGAGERRVVGRARDPVGEHDFAAADAFHAGVNPDEFVVLNRHPVLDFNPGNGEPETPPLEFCIRHAALPHERRAPEFAPHEVVAVVRAPHLIRLGIPYAHFRRSGSVCPFHVRNMLPRRTGCRTFLGDGVRRRPPPPASGPATARRRV